MFCVFLRAGAGGGGGVLCGRVQRRLVCEPSAPVDGVVLSRLLIDGSFLK